MQTSSNNQLMDTFLEMYKEFCRLKGYSPPTSPLEQLVDEAAGAEAQHMQEFAEWLRAEILPKWKLA